MKPHYVGQMAINVENINLEFRCAKCESIREDAEVAGQFPPSELVVKGEALGEQQRHLEALALHGSDREVHQTRRDALMAVVLAREDRADPTHRDGFSIEAYLAIENLDRRNDAAAIE